MVWSHDVRDDPHLVHEVRARILPQATPTATTGRGQVAPRRSVHQNRRSTEILVASGRSARECARHSDPRKRDGKAATRFFRTLLKKQGCRPRVLITDKLPSYCYQVAHRTTMSTTVHRQNKYLNNRAESSHQPTRPDPATGTDDERVPQRRFSVTVSGCVQSDFPALPPAPPPYDCHRLPFRNRRPVPGVGSGHRTDSLCLNTAPHDGLMRTKTAANPKQLDNAGLQKSVKRASNLMRGRFVPYSGRPPT